MAALFKNKKNLLLFKVSVFFIANNFAGGGRRLCQAQAGSKFKLSEAKSRKAGVQSSREGFAALNRDNSRFKVQSSREGFAALNHGSAVGTGGKSLPLAPEKKLYLS